MATSNAKANQETAPVSPVSEEAQPDDVGRAVEILKSSGCTEVFLFGSTARGEDREGSDIDLAVRGCPKGKFFHVLGRLMLELRRSVDLIDLDQGDIFSRYLERDKELVRVG